MQWSVTALKPPIGDLNDTDHYVTLQLFCWETFCPCIHVDATWHAPPTQTPLWTKYHHIDLVYSGSAVHSQLLHDEPSSNHTFNQHFTSHIVKGALEGKGIREATWEDKLGKYVLICCALSISWSNYLSFLSINFFWDNPYDLENCTCCPTA